MRFKTATVFTTLITLGFVIQPICAGDADIVFILDQSGSMNLPGNTGQANPPVAYVSGKDTLYYQNGTGCANTTSLGIITIQPRVGAAIQLQRITSNTGCANPAGDPFKVRALAVSQGIDYIASLSANSTVGYLPFGTGIYPPVAPVGSGAGPQRPLALTSANITLLKSRAIAESTTQQTNYDIPLDSTKAWLTNRAITPSLTNNHAIIFISDGAPNPAVNDGFAKNAGGFIHIDKNIPIYGIFMGSPSADTAKLKRLSDSTGGVFRRVPSQQPDSLISSVNRMIALILGAPSSIGLPNPVPALLRRPVENARWFDLRGRVLNGFSGKETPVLPAVIR